MQAGRWTSSDASSGCKSRRRRPAGRACGTRRPRTPRRPRPSSSGPWRRPPPSPVAPAGRVRQGLHRSTSFGCVLLHCTGRLPSGVCCTTALLQLDYQLPRNTPGVDVKPSQTFHGHTQRGCASLCLGGPGARRARLRARHEAQRRGQLLGGHAVDGNGRGAHARAGHSLAPERLVAWNAGAAQHLSWGARAAGRTEAAPRQRVWHTWLLAPRFLSLQHFRSTTPQT